MTGGTFQNTQQEQMLNSFGTTGGFKRRTSMGIPMSNTTNTNDYSYPCTPSHMGGGTGLNDYLPDEFYAMKHGFATGTSS